MKMMAIYSFALYYMNCVSTDYKSIFSYFVKVVIYGLLSIQLNKRLTSFIFELINTALRIK